MKRDLKINLTVNKLNFAQQFYYQVYDYDGWLDSIIIYILWSLFNKQWKQQNWTLYIFTYVVWLPIYIYVYY